MKQHKRKKRVNVSWKGLRHKESFKIMAYCFKSDKRELKKKTIDR